MGNSNTPQVYSPSAPSPTSRSAVTVTAAPASPEPELNLISPLMPRWEMLATRSRHDVGHGSSRAGISLKMGKCEETLQIRGREDD